MILIWFETYMIWYYTYDTQLSYDSHIHFKRAINVYHMWRICIFIFIVMRSTFWINEFIWHNWELASSLLFTHPPPQKKTNKQTNINNQSLILAQYRSVTVMQIHAKVQSCAMPCWETIFRKSNFFLPCNSVTRVY